MYQKLNSQQDLLRAGFLLNPYFLRMLIYVSKQHICQQATISHDFADNALATG